MTRHPDLSGLSGQLRRSRQPRLTGQLAVAAPLAAAVARHADAPLQPDREQARVWAREELARHEYQAERPSSLQLLLNWLHDLIHKLPSPDGVDLRLGATVATLLLLALVGYLLWRSGGVRRTAQAQPGELFEAAERTAEEHRRAAEAAETAGDLRTALFERFRAIARALSERTLVELSPGLTADEFGRRAALRFPNLTTEFLAAAQAFDDVRYGDRPALPDHVRTLRELDERASATTPSLPGTPVGVRLEVPR
jgi:hypothetical protein